jgi:molecular chaperone HscB
MLPGTATGKATGGSTARFVPMIDFSRNHFELFGLPARFGLDAAALDAAWRARQSEVHPDRFAHADDARKRLALQASARVNEAYRALRDPVARAEYLLALHGVDATRESDTALPLDFLERQLERRERADEAAAASDLAALAVAGDEVRQEARALEASLAALLDERKDYAEARTPVRELRFLTKVADDLRQLEARVDDALENP